MAKKQLQNKSQPPEVMREALCPQSWSGRAQVYQSTLQAPSWVSTATLPLRLPTPLWVSVTQGLEMSATRSSPKAAEEKLETSGGETRSGKCNAGSADCGTAAALPACARAVGPTWLTPPESLVHITSFLARPTVVPWKSMPLWD